MLKRYYEFLLESVLYTSKELKEILQSIDDDIAKDFLQLIDNDVETPYNALNVTDKNDTISFLPDNQFQRKLTSSNLATLLKGSPNQTSVGRLVQKILQDNKKTYTSNQITEFTDKFKAAWTKYYTEEEKEPIRVVIGEEIRDWYLLDNYNIESRNGIGTLGKSCMRYPACEKYFDIYVQNPDVCKMIILTKEEDGEEVLYTRALLWKTENEGWYLDRIYFTDASERILIQEYAKKNYSIKHSYDSGVTPRLTIQLTSKTVDYDNYPYMDSFPYYYTVERKLFNYEPSVSNRANLYSIQQTDGSFERLDLVYCELDDNYYDPDEMIWSEYHGCSIPMSQSVYSEYFSSEIFEPKSCYSNALEDYLPEDDVREVFLDVEGRKSDYYPKDHEDVANEADTGDYYLKELLVRIGKYYYLPKNLATIYTIEPESKKDYCRIFNKEENLDISKCFCTEAVAQGFGFKTSKTENQMSRIDYLRELYGSVIFSVLESRFSKLLKETEYSEDIIDEIDDAKYYIRNIGLSASLNYVHKLGGLEAFIKMYIELLGKTTETTSASGSSFSSVFSKTVRDPFLFDILLEIAKSSGLSEIATENLLKSTKATIHKIITKHLYEFLIAVEDVSPWLVEIDSSKVKNIVKIIETDVENFDVLEDSEVAKDILLTIISRVIWQSVTNLQRVTGWDIRYSSLNFFFKNTNKLKLLEYNP